MMEEDEVHASLFGLGTGTGAGAGACDGAGAGAGAGAFIVEEEDIVVENEDGDDADDRGSRVSESGSSAPDGMRTAAEPGTTQVIVAYAFGDQTGDRERLCRMADAMSRGPPARPPLVVTVSVLTMTKAQRLAHLPLLHSETNFKVCERGFVPTLRRDATLLLLDYFWIASGYYEKSYGNDWVGAKVPRAFSLCPLLRAFVLPNDSTGVMLKMMQEDGEALVLSGLAYHFLSWREARAFFPLVRASEEASVEELGQRHQDHVKYVDAAQPFVCFFRATETWRSALEAVWV